MEILREVNYIDDEEVARIQDFVNGNHVVFEEKKRLSYEQKLEVAEHSFAKKILEIAIAKKSNLIASADFITTKELLDFADFVGPHIVALKTHIDILNDFDADETILPLKDLATKHNFLLMEDRKFADIGNTQELQFSYGTYKISNWADLVTSHVIGGSKSLDCFMNVGVVAILGMSSQGSLTDSHYREEALKVIENHPNIIGCVAQNQISDNLLLFTPGVNLSVAGDDKGQQYNSPEHVIINYGTDFIIVGRGIYKADEPEQEALRYKNEGWKAYQDSL